MKQRSHRLLPPAIVMGMAKDKGTPTTPKQEMEARQSKPWTLKEFWGKTAWDWMELLIVPVMILLITVAFTWQQNSRQEAIEEQRAQDLALQGYLDQMGRLMLEDLSDPNVQTVMRARTLTVLRRLDPSHKSEVIQFLVEAQLVQRVEETAPIINLSNANLSGANLSGANLSGANLRDANLSYANLSYADMRAANLFFTDLRHAEFGCVDLKEAHLRPDELLACTDLRDANLSNAKLSYADMRAANLSGADLSYANLRNANLSSADLDTDLSNADMYSIDLSGANLAFANLSNADLSESDLFLADLFFTDLSDADLGFADLSGADLHLADLSGADLGDAVGVSKQELEQKDASFEGATMPNGQKYEE